MKILIVANHNKGYFVPFIVEQADELKRLGVDIEYYGIHGKGIFGYLSNMTLLNAKIIEFHPNLIHAHYGLSGLLANLQRKVPVVTTFHGSDIHEGGRNLFFSRLAMRLSAYNIFVSEQLQKQADCHGNNQSVIPCGVDTTTIFPIDRVEARKLLGWDLNGKYVLFAGAFDNKVKNCSLAKAAVGLIPDVQLMEMRGYNRKQVNWAMNATNCLLMTSHREGSPQVIKEALMCGTPIVSVDVGDVKEVVAGIDGCYVTSYEISEVSRAIKQSLLFQGRTNGQHNIIKNGLSNELVTKHLLDIYASVLNKK